VVDIGCGAGAGLRSLVQKSHAKVTGIDCDGKAVAFAREYLPDSELLHLDIQAMHGSVAGTAALVIDVLGLAPDPARLLRSVLRRVSGIEVLFVAEPIALVDQTLVPPARRAFSVSTLTSLFVRSGFDIDDWTTVDGTFLCAIGRPSRDPLADALVQAEDAYLSHQSQRFEMLCTQLSRSGCTNLRLEAALLESRFRFDLNQFDRAIALLTDATVLIPEDPRAWAGLARLALVSGNADQAARLAKTATRLDSSDFSAVCSFALAQMEADSRHALQAWRIANALAPDEELIARLLCATALIQGRHDEGLTVIERLGQYVKQPSRLNEHAGLLALTTAAVQSYRSC